MRRYIMVLAALLVCTASSMAQEARLLRFPAVHKDMVAFVYAGDIYTAPRTGGQATRLTSHDGREFFPRFSPDGSKIAFTGQYDGDMAVYVMPVEGGHPSRLTWHPGAQNTSERMGPENVVMGWSPDGTKVMFRSRMETASDWDGRIYLVNLTGSLPEPLPMMQAGFTSFSPDGKKVAYCPIYRDFRTWKRYMGGTAQDVWIYDLEKNTSEQITDWAGTDNVPMWYGDKIYFNSDRTDGKLNLYRYDIATKQVTQVTKFEEYDVRWPSLGIDGIAFENGGYLYVMDLPSEQVHKVEIKLITDHHTMRPEIKDVSKRIGDFDIAPNGKRAVFAARGDLFSVPAKDGNTRRLITRSDAREGSPQWSPDGKWIAFYSDITGEEELYVISHDGADTVQLTSGNRVQRYDPEWSPDSKRLIFFDMTNAVRSVDVSTKQVVTIDSADYGGLGGPSWSADSRFVAYTKNLSNFITTIFVYSFDDRAIHQVTPGYTNDYWPSFSPDGKYLYFLSERNFNPVLGNYEFSFINQAIDNLYAVVLQKDGKSPFEKEGDEGVTTDDEGDADQPKGKASKKSDGKDDEKKAEPTPVRIDFDGIFDREVAIDLPAGNYSSVVAVDGAVFYMSQPLRGLRGPVGDGKRTLHKYDIAKEEDHEFAEGIGGFCLSPDGKHMLVAKEGSYFIVGTEGPKADLTEGKLDLSHLSAEVDHEAEYRQMLREAWRGERDFFYDADMHGVDWDEIWSRYSVMLPYVTHRFDLTYLTGEMLGELACSHTYTGAGEMPEIQPGKVGLLGCDFGIDTKANRIRFARIFHGENFDQELRSPLCEPGVDVREGDYLLAINGRELTGVMNPYRLTENTLGQKITLTVNDRPSMQGARQVVVKPITEEVNLRYFAWVQDNLHYVDSVSNGQIGYIHIPDMDSYGLYRFTKMFYHQMRKPGLIIDVRWNGGGFVSGLILERLRRTLVAAGKGRYGSVWPDPGDAVHAHMITLMNEFSCSDGDYFPYFFREYKLGPLMGKRTWGGVIGINGFTPLVDGGYYTVPAAGIYNLQGDWVMENRGVEPDIEVENRPERLVAGFDDQLDRAIADISRRLKEDPKVIPTAKGAPTPR